MIILVRCGSAQPVPHPDYSRTMMRILEIAYEYSKIIELRLSNSQFTPEEMKKAYEADTSNLIQLVLLYEKFYRSYDLMRDDQIGRAHV